MVPNPCTCLGTLQQACKIWAFIEWGCQAFVILPNLYWLYIGFIYSSGVLDSFKYTLIAASLFSIILSLLVALMAFFFLYQGAEKRDIKKCKLWFIFSLFCEALFLLLGLILFIIGWGGWYMMWFGFAKIVIYKILELMTVYAFMEELARGRFGFGNANVNLFSAFNQQGQVGQQPEQAQPNQVQNQRSQHPSQAQLQNQQRSQHPSQVASSV